MQSGSRKLAPLSLLLAALGATFVPGSAFAAPEAEFRGLFLEPRVTILRSGERYVQVAPMAILGWELAAVPPARVVAPSPIPLPAGLGPGVPAGTVFGEELGPDGRAACLYPDVPAGRPPPSLCLFDSDGDGRSDRAVAGERSWAIAPIRLTPAIAPTTHPGAATIERRIRVGSVNDGVATIVDQWAVRPSDGRPGYAISPLGSQLPYPWPGRLELPLRAGARASNWGLDFEVSRGADGKWWIRVSGAMTLWVTVRAPGTVVDFFGGTFERSR